MTRGPSRRTLSVSLSGTCPLACRVCDCRERGPSPEAIEARLAEGGRRVTLRSADGSPHLERIVSAARTRGIAEVVVRTSAVGGAADRVVAARADAAIVPFFSHDPRVHDRVAGRRDALVQALVGIRALARAGVGVEAEVPLLAPRLQDLEAVVDLVARAVGELRAVRFYAPAVDLPEGVAPPRWSELVPGLVRALDRCHALGAAVVIGRGDGIPICALRDHPEVQERAVRFAPKGRAPAAATPQVCRDCAVVRQCDGVTAAYRQLHGEVDLQPYAARPKRLFAAQRTTAPRSWTESERAAAARVNVRVLRPTVHCNQDCVFCSANETSNNVWEDPRAMIRRAARLARTGVSQISFSGGEPTLSSHLPSFVRAARRAGTPAVEVVTNAVLLARREKAEALAEAGLTDAFVSLHAHDEALSRAITLKAGDFQRTVRGVHNLVAAGVRVRLNHVICSLNYRYLEAFIDFVADEYGGASERGRDHSRERGHRAGAPGRDVVHPVTVSFAFVTPQYRALDHLEVMPRISEVMPYLARAAYRGIERGVGFVVGSRQGIPPCFLRELAGWSDFYLYTAEAAVEDAFQKEKPPACEACKFSELCPGLWKPYVARHGTAELEPVPGAKLTDPSTLRSLDVGVRSFDDIPGPLRRPEREGLGVAGWPLGDGARAVPGPLPIGRSRPVRALLAGSGSRAHELFAAVEDVPGLAVTAVASPHAGDEHGARFGHRPTFTDVRRALEETQPDCLIIAADTRVHVELLRTAVACGVPTLVEKPVGGDPSAVREIAAEAAARGVVVVPAHQVLFTPGLRELLDLAPHAEVHCLRAVRAGQPDLPLTWNRRALFETLYHWAALVNALTGGGVPAVEVEQALDVHRPRAVRLRLDYGAARALVQLRAGAPADELTVRAGERVWTRQAGSSPRATGSLEGSAGATETRPTERRGGDLAGLLEHFARVVTGDEPPRASLDDAVLAIEAAERAIAALEAAGVELERPSAPRHAASKGMTLSYS